METPVAAAQAPQPGGTPALRKSRQWSDLSPDMLLAVSARLHDAADFVRFHAVCTSWRDRLHSAATRPKFLPWLLWPSNDGQIVHSPMVYSGHVEIEVSSEDASSSHRGDHNDDIVFAAAAPSAGGGGRNWVASADGTAVWLFAGGPEPKLINNLVTGIATPLPPFPDDIHRDVIKRMSNPHGVVYGDGTVFLYSCEKGYGPIFTAAVLRPGKAMWAVMKKRLNRLANYCCAAYHDDKVLVWENLFWCCILDFQDNTDQYTSVGELKTRCREAEDRRYGRFCSYVLESRGELLRASILVEHEWLHHHYLDGPSPPLSVTVHTLEEGAGGEMRWARTDAYSLGDRVLFLGSRASFAVDAAQLGIEGGCAYFVFMSRVYRCSLVNGEAKLVKPLRCGCCVWLQPQPAIAPVQKIREKLKALSKQEDDKS